MDKYTKVRELGRGTFGVVYLVKSLKNKKLYALKQIQLDESRTHRKREAVQCEAQILSQLKHPNIVAYHDSFFDNDQENLFIVQDYCDGGTLENNIAIAAQAAEYYDEKQIMQWFVQIAMAVQYIHSQKVLHRDLKTPNVFIMRTGDLCKVGDFGISKKMSATLDRASTFVGTTCCLAPEMCQDIPYSSKADIWALGCLLYEMCALRPAFDGSNQFSIMFKIVKGNREPIPSHYSASLRDLVDRVLNKDPDERPSACQLLNLPFVKQALGEFVASGKTASGGVKGEGRNCSPDSRQPDDSLSATLTHWGLKDLSSTAANLRVDSKKLSPSPCPQFKRHSDTQLKANDDAVENLDYEDDFEVDDSDRNSIASKEENVAGESILDSSSETDYCDDFEECSPEQEFEEAKNRAKELQRSAWDSNGDVTIMDDSLVDIRQMLKPHCEAVVGQDRFRDIVEQKLHSAASSSQRRANVYSVRSRGALEMCHFIEELYGGVTESHGGDS